MNTPSAAQQRAQGTPNRPRGRSLPAPGMLIDSEPLFGLFNSFHANDSKKTKKKSSARVKFWARRHRLAGKARVRSRRSWGACDPCPPCPSVPPEGQRPASPSPRRNIGPSPFVAIKRKAAFVSVPEPTSSCFSFSPLLSDDFGPDSPTPSAAVPELQPTMFLIYRRYQKGSAQRCPHMVGSDARCSPPSHRNQSRAWGHLIPRPRDITKALRVARWL